MDPVTQGVFGALFAQVKSNKKDIAKAGAIGALAGMAPDLDILIRSSGDPLLALEYHRHFTHSLLFIPIGALLCCAGLFVLLGRRWGLSFKQVYIWCLIGYATHGLLDGCTSYGTQLFWPLSDHRFAWDVISVIDPLVTLPLLLLVYLASKRKRRLFVYSAITWVVMYFGLATVQHERVIQIAKQLAYSRGHAYENLQAKPSFANIFVWKIIYEAEEKYYVDAIHPGLFQSKVWEGDHVQKLNIERDLPWLDAQSQQAKDVERFRWFSGGFIALDPSNSLRIMDIRYSLLPNQIAPLWGIELSKTASPEQHVDFKSEHKRPKHAISQLLKMILMGDS